MIYLLVRRLLDSGWLESHRLGFLRVFTADEFGGTAAIVLAFVICIVLAPPVIQWLRRQKIGDLPNFGQAEVDKLMEGKKGTPTMGGLLIICAIFCTVLLLADLTDFYIKMALICVVWLGGVGATDDWLKLTAGRRANSRQGLSELEKLLFQIGLAVLLSYFTFQYGRHLQPATNLYFPFLKNASLPLNVGLYVAIGTLVMVGSSNAVNLTDGLDGLASGCMAIASFTFLVLALIVGNQHLSQFLLIPHVAAAGQMAVVAGAMVGACLGFLWFNCNPARVFMGDTGSLALGGLIGYTAIVIRHELVLIFVGGIFVAEAASSLIQKYYFKYTRIRYGEGKRIFLMAPLHHHFQRKGWTESQIVVRFWVMGFLLGAMALATIKLR